MRRSNINAVSARVAERDAEAVARLMDGDGVYFDEAEAIFWKVRGVAKLRRPHRPEIREQFRGPGLCLICENVTPYGEPHHIVHGTVGRSDELTNLMRVCRECHNEIQSDARLLSKVLLAKWTFEPEQVSWVRLALLRDSWWPFDSLGR